MLLGASFMASEGKQPWLGEGLDTVVASELKSLKPGARVYERKSGLFFLTTRDAALETTQQRLKAERELEKHHEQSEKASTSKLRK